MDDEESRLVLLALIDQVRVGEGETVQDRARVVWRTYPGLSE
jgi:hypothetical protein